MSHVLALLVPAAAAIPLRFAPRAWAAPALVLIAFVDFVLSCIAAARAPISWAPTYFAERYFVLDATSVLFLVLINVVFFAISVYMLSRVKAAPALQALMPWVAALSLAFMAAMNMAILSNHLIVMWGMIEASTMAIAPLVALGEKGAKRAAWRYVLYSTISLSLSFLGFLCLMQSAQHRGVELSLFVDELHLGIGAHGDVWQRLGIALILFGFGSKLGLAPLYGWLPETYDCAPPSVSAMLAAIQFNGPMVAVLRIFQVFRSDDADFIAEELLVMGALSLCFAAVHVMAARNYKRLIAYVCVSSMGVIAIGLAVGRAAAYGVILYVVSNAFVKTLLFLAAGKIKSTYGTKDVSALSGVIRQLPLTGLVFMVGTFALLGFPPFGSFMAEMLILSGVVQTGHFLVFTLLCATLTVVFVATGRALFPMIWGEPKNELSSQDSLLAALPTFGFVLALISLGIYAPAPVTRLLRVVAASIGGP